MEKRIIILFLALISVGVFGQNNNNPKKQLSDVAVYLKSDIDFLAKMKNLGGDSLSFYEIHRDDVDLFASSSLHLVHLPFFRPKNSFLTTKNILVKIESESL